MLRKSIGLVVIVLGAIGLVITGYVRWHNGQVFPSTEDAYVGGDVYAVAGRLPGELIAVSFHDHEFVEAGQVLAQLDPRDFDNAIVRAEADLAKAEAALALDEARIAGAQAQLAVARSQAKQAEADLARFTVLQERGSTPERQLEEARTAADVARAQVTAAQKALAAAEAGLEVDRKGVTKSRATLDDAHLQRSYCAITAPASGYVADKSAHVGQVVGAGQPLCRIAPLTGDAVWIDANFKETQLRFIRVGQPATIAIDAVDGHEYTGKVAAFSAGTGSAFALLPPENASGNWVKIVQRLPVRIALDGNQPELDRLRLGLSATVKVDTREPGER